MVVFFIQWIIVYYYHYLFWGSNCLAMASGSPFSVAPWPLHIFLTFLEWFLTFWHHTVFRLILYFPCSSSVINHFSKEPWFLLEGIWCCLCSLLLVYHCHQAPSIDKTREYMHVYSYIYQYIWLLNNMGVRDTGPCAVENMPITFDSPKT